VERILARRNDDRWRVPIALGVSHTISEGVPALFAQLLDELLYQEGRTPEQEQRDLLLAAELAEDAGWYRLERGGAAFKRLRRDLAAALVPVVQGTTLPAKDRVQAGMYLGWLGDPRPGVCTLPPAMVRIEGGEFVIGILPGEEEEYFQAFRRDYPDVYDDTLRNLTRAQINDQLLRLNTFEIARYPLTNAQWKLFIDDGGYNPNAVWWDEAGQAWLHSRRKVITQPSYWDNQRLGMIRRNHPVVAITWYEAVAFCRWLTQHPEYNPESYVYVLPSEAEWEYAARRATRRVYPWGNEEPDAERANSYQIYLGTTAVGCFAPGVPPEERTGQKIYDLAGNVFEWTRSEYRAYSYDPGDGREDMDNPAEKGFTLRGGGSKSFDLRASPRFYYSPIGTRDFFIGCRLARRLPPNKT
jgi:formylglycine-generating enzyme required for sulfatase activity